MKSILRAKTLFKAGASLGVLVALAAVGDRAEAAGFAIKEQSGSSLGQAFSNASTGLGDASHMFFNAATLASIDSYQVVAVGNYIVPRSDVSNANGTFNPSPLPGASYGDIAEDAAVPAFYVAAPVTDDVVVGLGVNAPFGLVTEYPTYWAGATHGIKSDLATININPAVAWQINEMFAVGVGARIQYADAELTSRTGAAPSDVSSLKGDDWGYGFNIGALFEPTDDLRFGAGFQSEIDHTLEGTISGFFPVPGIGNVAPLPASADLTTPAMLSLGMTYDIDEQFSVSAEAQYTFWSSFDELRVVNPTLGTVSLTEEDWDDQIFLSVGGEYRLDDKWTLRAGLAYDQTPIPDANRTPRIPGGDRYWVAVGASYEVNEWFGVDAGYSHIFVEDTEVRLTDPALGDLSADYDNGIDLFSVQARISF